MLFVSNLAAAPGAANGPAHGAAVANLGRGQCNCAYWHGIFGGLYLNYLRHAIFYHLLKAEVELERCKGLVKRPSMQAIDHDGLGWDQVLVRGFELDALFDPGHGLCLSRLDYLPTHYCWSNVFTRRREAYHKLVPKAVLKDEDTGHDSIHDRILTKERGLERKLVFDKYPRSGFITYFSHLNNLESLLEVPDRPDHVFEATFNDYFVQTQPPVLSTTLLKAIVPHAGFTIEKRARLTKAGLALTAKLVDGQLPVEDGLFCLEFNFTLLTDQSPERHLLLDGTEVSLSELISFTGITQIALVDDWQHRKLTLFCATPFQAVCYPVKTVSSSEGGFEQTYQGSCLILAVHPLALQDELLVSLEIRETP